MTARSSKKRGEDAPSVPGWIVSFTDMVTLLLAFFVLLQAFAHVRDPELFYRGQGSFIRAIKALGLPGWLMGKPDRPERQYVKVKHPTEAAKELLPRNKVLDAEDEDIREAFRDLQRAMEIRSSDLPEVSVETTAAPVRFRPGGVELDPPARDWLTRFAMDVRESRTCKDTTIHVTGQAPDARPGKQQWVLSAMRARAVADFLGAALSPHLQPTTWDVNSCGAGPGNPSSVKTGDPGKQSFIVIAIEGAKGRHGR